MKTTTSLAALLVGGLLFSGAAFAQDAGQLRRLERLEAGAAALGGRGVEVAQADMPHSLAADFEVRLQRMERTLSELTGRYEEAVYQMSQLKDRLERINGDVDFRLQALEKGGGGGLGGGLGGGAATAPSAPAGKTPDKPAAPPAAPPATAAKPADTKVAALPPGAGPEKQYEHAFELLSKADYDRSEKEFREFLAKNKSHNLAGNAQYWLGETYYVRNKFVEAASAFAEAIQKYPKGTKAPDSLLKLGMSLAQLKQNADACTAFGQLVTKFPDASASIKRRAETERRRLNCK
ncbi:tol-pal system protein YbgF [Azospirillum sp.]|uniref:tol-pal system protein YbgF n=1 Tax=Azospirillum sp. TaxID=34012 RepID=UPI002D7580AB|nr:tol-pal system protein YbgF [Azospirillum sp.]HYD65800.1 tol-pal system protein YbgF [Azospirillum sp.]